MGGDRIEPFSKAEHEGRWERGRRLMRAAELDALLLTSEANFRYVTGFHSQTWQSPTRPRYVVLPLDGAPVAVVPQSNLQGMRAADVVGDVRTWPAPRPEDDGVTLVAEALKACARRFGAIGAELGPESRLGMPAGDFLRLVDMVAPVAVKDGSAVMRALRMVKSPAEVARIGRIAGIVSDAFEALPARLAAGETERQVARALQADIILRGAEKTPYVVLESGPGGYGRTNMGPTDRALEPGDLLFIDTGSTYDGYWCDYDRHFAIGRPWESAARAHDVVYRATDAGLAAVRPGARASDLWRAMAGVLAEAGDAGSVVGRMGHGLGLNITEPPSLTEHDHTVLAPGMVVTIEPSMSYRAAELPDAPARLMVHEENVLVTEDGSKLLSRRAPREIPVVG